MCVGVCGGLLLDRNHADLAVVWSYGIVLQPNSIWACQWRSAGVCGGVLRHLGCVWGRKNVSEPISEFSDAP